MEDWMRAELILSHLTLAFNLLTSPNTKLSTADRLEIADLNERLRLANPRPRTQ
jgi:hypothetical protein